MEAPGNSAGLRRALLALLLVYVLVRAYWVIYDAGGRMLDPLWAQTSVQILLWVLPCVAVTMFWHGVPIAGAWRELGLSRGLGRGMAFGAIATLPMAIAVLLAGGRWPHTGILVAHGVLGPIAESVLFSGFLFSQLAQRAAWSVPAALVTCALAFGLAHVDNVDMLLAGTAAQLAAGLGPDLLVERIIPAVVATGLGGLLFTWTFYRWGTLWPAIALHAAINFWWAVSGDGIFQATLTRQVVTPVAAAQAVSMALAIALTLTSGTRRQR